MCIPIKEQVVPMHPQMSPIAQYWWNRCTGVEQKMALSVGRVAIELVTVDIDRVMTHLKRWVVLNLRIVANYPKLNLA